MPGIEDCYRILELQPGATLKEVKAAYRKLVRVWHPDRYGHDKKMQARAQEQLKAINNAYEILSAHLGSDKESHKQGPSHHHYEQQKATKKEEARRQHEEAKQRQEQARQAQEKRRQEQEATANKKRQEETRRQQLAYILNILKSKPIIAIFSFISISLIWFLAQTLYNDYTFNSMIGDANTALGNKNYKKASEFYDKACKIFGYENGVAKQPELVNLKNYANCMNEAENAINSKDYEKAKDAYKKSMGVPGYEFDEDAKRFLKIIDNRIADLKKQKEFEDNIKRKNELSDMQKRKEDDKKKAVDAENHCAEMQRKAEAVDASINTPSLWNGATTIAVDAKKKYSDGDFVKSQEFWDSAAAEYEKAVSEIEKKKNVSSIDNRVVDIKKQKEADDKIRKINERSDIRTQIERGEKSKALYADDHCFDLQRKAEAVEASNYTPSLWNSALTMESEASEKYRNRDFVKAQELWDSAAAEYEKAVAEIEKKRNAAETAFNSASTRVSKDILPTIKDSTRSYTERMKACDEGLTAVSDMPNTTHLKASSKRELSELQAQIRNLKSSLIPSQKIDNLKSETISLTPELAQIPVGFEMVKGPAADTNGLPQEIKHKVTGIEMVYVAPGEFMMGLTDQEQDEAVRRGAPRDWVKGEVQHRVKLTKGYYIGKFEVTQGQWESVMGNNPSYGKASGKDAPVGSVSWDDCQAFCRKLGGDFRLPTGAEWEFAARGGNKSKGFVYSGSNDLDEVGWYNKNSGYNTHPVGQKKSNELGIYDMSGNAFEWCSDRYGDYPSGSVTDPTGASIGSNRILWGGSVVCSDYTCTVAHRYGRISSSKSSDWGFRLMMDISSTEGKQNTVISLAPPIANNKPDGLMVTRYKQGRLP